ncbi:MAG: hypothetical protein JWO86_2328 [Myxococcaceae bacterium]|nr:hypothetical protein [Myxococcaceae bacterium]
MPARLTHARRGRYTPRVPSPKRITSVVYAVFVIVAAAFVITSTVEIAQSVLAEPSPGAANAASVRVAPACAEGVRTLAVAVDRGVAAAATATDRQDGERRYRAARGPEWEEPKRSELLEGCSDPQASAHGIDAVAAVTRLDRAAEGAIRRQTDELGPVRRAVDSFIR